MVEHNKPESVDPTQMSTGGSVGKPGNVTSAPYSLGNLPQDQAPAHDAGHAMGEGDPHSAGDRLIDDLPYPSHEAHAPPSKLPWLIAALAAAGAGFVAAQLYWPARQKLAASQDQLQTLSKDASNLQDQVKQLTSENDELRSARERLTQEVTRKDDALNELQKTQDELTRSLQDEIKRGEVLISQVKGQIVVDVTDKILFDSGEAKLNQQGQEVLKRVGTTLLNAQDKVLQVSGHTDNVPIARNLVEKFPTNWELSTARATEVVRFLQEQAKIPGKRLIASGYAEYKPIASNATKNGRKRNRRIEIILLSKEIRAK
jgi:chemotaxis protein MotB